MGTWTERELATLAEVAETFVRGDARRRARLTTEAIERAADPEQLRQFHRLLRLMESRLANLFLGRRPTPFTSMSPAARERYLLTWSRSPFPSRRTAFGTLRKLMTFLAYADPGVDASGNPRHALIGYEPEYPPITDDRTPIEPYPLPFGSGTDAEPITLEADVVVVGSGAGGGVVAATLAEAGRSVVILDAGPFVDEATMPRNELDAFRQLYLNHGLLSTWDGSITMLAGSAVGGGTLINWSTTMEAPAVIRDEWRREHGLADLDDGEAWTSDISALEADLAVSVVRRPPPKDQAILRGAQRLGWEAAPVRRGALDCDDCGSCPFGCRRGSKQSGIRVHLARAASAGARVVPQVRVTKVLIERGRAVGVQGKALIPGNDPVPRTRPLVVRARQVVLAAGGLRTPALLQASGIRHRAIGRNLQLHPVPLVAGRMTMPVDMWHGPMQGARSLQFIDADRERNGYVIESAPGHLGILALAQPWDGTDAHAASMRDSRYLAPLIAVTRDGGTGRVTLTRAGRVRVDYRLDQVGVATLRHAAVRMARLARAAGAGEIVVAATPGIRFTPVRSSPESDSAAYGRFEDQVAGMDLRPNRGSVFSAHQMGTVRMGDTPRDHPCDPYGRVRARGRRDRLIGGLYVADASLFPTGIGINPMLTVMALARRVSRTVLTES
ncbi:MAG TPA: GMC family oxidoreductase N-terminal domain-containing protein [Candidatus Limnocylindrales bacterium]